MKKKKILSLILVAVTAASCSLFPARSQEDADAALMGDVNGDGTVNINDVTVTQTALAKLADLTDTQAMLADSNQNGEVDIDDATMIQQYLAEMNAAPVGSSVRLSELLPDYCLRETQRVKRVIEAEAGENDVVFGMFTDMHFAGEESEESRKQKENAVRAMRRLADVAPLDFVIQGGDLVTYGPREHDDQVYSFVQETFKDSPAPLYTAKGDHDSAQKQGERISLSQFVEMTSPYMPQAVRCEAYPNNYYFDLPEKKTRVICLDTGTIMAGQSRLGTDFATWSHPVLYHWLLDEVFSDDVKDGWQFVMHSHSPLDAEWSFGMAEQYKNDHKDDEDPSKALSSSLRNAKGFLIQINSLFNAINTGGTFSTKMSTALYQASYDDNHVLQSAEKTSDAITIDNQIYGITGIDNGKLSLTKDFSGWTSRAKLVVSGHCHCDRLNNSTLMPDENGNYSRQTVSYGIGYTGSAARYGAKKETYYTPCFGKDGEIASRGHILNRTYGDISEQLMDVCIVGEHTIKRVRFGAGAGSPLLSTEITIE